MNDKNCLEFPLNDYLNKVEAADAVQEIGHGEVGLWSVFKI